MRFSVITVCLNPGKKLKTTLESVLQQTCSDVEIVLKDGGSTDGSVERWQKEGASVPGAERIRIIQEKDSGIYDAMNQAVSHAKGDFLLFLNCGDVFPDNGVLERTLHIIEEEEKAGTDMDRLVLYGDTYSGKNNVTIASPPVITGFTCYRNIPCHQSCFYSAALCREKPFDLQYKIRGDYDHFLWCFYRGRAKMRHMDFPVAGYEGGGYSESLENRRQDKQEHRQITASYMDKAEIFKYQAALGITLAPLRSRMAESKAFSGIYHWLKERIYHRKLWIVFAALFFLLEMALLVWPVGWLGEEQASYLFGEGAWALEASEDNAGYCQEFRPQYGHLRSIGVVLAAKGELPEQGNILIEITDAGGEVLFNKEIPYGQAWTDSYMDVETDLFLRSRKRYYLSISFEADASGNIPSLKVYGTDYYMPENISLTQTDKLEGVQLLTRYIYEDAIPQGKFMCVLTICGLTAVGIALGLPQNRRMRQMVGVILSVFGPYVLGIHLELLAVNETVMLPFAIRWNVGLMYLFEVILLLCTQSFRISICVSNIFLTLLYSANYFVYSFRGEPLRLNDLAAVKTAARVVGNYSLRPNDRLAFVWCIALLLVVFGVQTGIRRKAGKTGLRLAGRLVTFAVGVVLLIGGRYVLLYSDFLVDNGFMDIHGFDQNMNYHFNGYLVASFMDIQNSRVDRPEGYSVEKVEAILEAQRNNQKEVAVQEMPHIILIMNESFSDLRVLGNLCISEENLPFFYSLTENTIHGYVNASVLGGGTANSEFEVFTGCSMGFLSRTYYPYQQCIVKPVSSMISNMENAGYTTYSIHPENKENWNRDRIYQYLGFDTSLWIEDFQDCHTIHNGVSDLETYKKVEELFENRQEGQKLFIFDLTMQNHGGYTYTDVERSITATNVSSEEADIYLSLIHESDSAFKQLVTYFAQQKEPVIICMYGDHQPKITEDSFYEGIYGQTDDLEEIDKKLNIYKTPFIIWANYNIPEYEEMDIGMSYLGALLMDVAEVPCSPFFSFLQQYMKEYPMVTVNGYRDKEGNFNEWSGQDNELLEYRMLQYNYLFDAKTVSWGF